MARSISPDLLEAAGRFLAAHPTASNLDLLRFLTASRGEVAVRGIAINRVRALIREPALQWLREERERARAGAGAEPMSSKNGALRPAPPIPPAPESGIRSARARSEARPSQPVHSGPDPARVEEALVEAFTLGAECRTRGDLVRAWARLERLRTKLV